MHGRLSPLVTTRDFAGFILGLRIGCKAIGGHGGIRTGACTNFSFFDPGILVIACHPIRERRRETTGRTASLTELTPRRSLVRLEGIEKLAKGRRSSRTTQHAKVAWATP